MHRAAAAPRTRFARLEAPGMARRTFCVRSTRIDRLRLEDITRLPVAPQAARVGADDCEAGADAWDVLGDRLSVQLVCNFLVEGLRSDTP